MSAEEIADRSEQVMRWLELGTALFLVALFSIGVYDLGLSLYHLVESGRYTNTNHVIELIDKVLILLVIVEVFETVIAFSREGPVLRIVITAALIAITRKIISFHPGDYPNVEAAFISAGSVTLLLAVLIAAYFVIRQVEPEGGESMKNGR